MMAVTLKGLKRPARTLLLAVTVATLVAACGSDDDDDDMSGNTDGDMDMDMDMNGNGDGDDNGDGGDMSMGTTSLDALAAQDADSQPIDDGLDQVEADLLTTFGPADGIPFPVTDEDTAATLLSPSTEQ